LQRELNTKQSRLIRHQVTQNLLDKVQCDLPDSLVEEETRNIVYGIVSENQQRGIAKEAIDAEKEQIYASANATAKQRVKATFIFQRVAEKEGVRVEQVEIVRRLQDLAAQFKVPLDKLVKDFEKSGRIAEIYNQLLSEKVIDLLVQFARIQDVSIAAP
jgi:trigger factor